ncbi:lysophospholipid acyltransferase family protein [Pseudofrancisella aestuarii]|uniref:Lysophospholipid acyltransferase family protein n=1 Tax=Pseudofrancisella aestuarii TaxID=2670347 RepID=A0ABV9TC05_9GAMM|nr:lysophospholipid acyltransferase family protein [Pseudofrancisella aestuarii]
MNKRYLLPRYWTTWFVIGLMRFISIFPYKFQIYFTLVIGFFVKPFLKKRNLIAKINLRIAFPDKTEKEIETLANESYRSMVLAGAEAMMAWFMSNKKFKKINFEKENFEVFEKLHLDPNKTVIVLGFHFHCIEVVGRYIGQNYYPFTVMYQKNDNELIEELIKKYREKYIYKCLDSKNFISVIKTLKKHISMWYAPDQDFGLESSGVENSVFAPFFGKLCSTLTVTPWLAEKTGAIVVPAYYVRLPKYSGYKIVVGDPLEFTGDDYKDAEMTNKFLEDAIKKYPEQYLWQHRRYRTRPNGESQIY